MFSSKTHGRTEELLIPRGSGGLGLGLQDRALPGSVRAIAVGGAKAFVSNGCLPSRLFLAGYTHWMGPRAEIPECHLAACRGGSGDAHGGLEPQPVRCWVVPFCQAAPVQVLCQCRRGEETSEVGSVLLKNWFSRL